MPDTVGITGLVEVPATDTDSNSQTALDLYTLFGAGTGGGSPYRAEIQVSQEEFDVTAFGASLSSMAYVGGINSWTGTVAMRFPSAAPVSGRCGDVTFASGYDLLIRQYAMNMNAQSFDTTEMGSTCPQWRSFVPGLVDASGSYTGGLDSATSITLPLPSGSAAATFRLSDETGTDNTLAANIFATSAGPTIEVGGLNQVTHNFRVDGAVTAAGSTPLFPAGAVGTPDITEIVVKADDNRTYTGKCFWTGVASSVAIGSSIDIVVGFQGTGELVEA